MVSVCMATFNGGKYIKEQIDSIIEQLGENDELIISDDGSTDNTIELIKEYADKRIKLIYNNGRHGYTWNFENALKHATGDIIYLSDQDDVWKKDKVSVTISLLKECDLVIHNADIVDSDLKLKGIDYFSTTHKHTGFFWNLYKTRCLGCCMAFKRILLTECLPFPKNIVAHDYWLGMYALSKFKVRFIDDSLLLYRRHGNNASSSSEKSDNNLFYQLITKRLPILTEISKRLIQKSKTCKKSF